MKDDLLSIELKGPDYHDTCFRCGSDKLPENQWCVFKEDGVSSAPVCDACSNDTTPGEIAK